MTSTRFTKMHGLGNDFIVLEGESEISPERARLLCDRRLGIGADQILMIRKPKAAKNADARMDILNSDGSVAEMCGNGIRAVALHLHQQTRKTSYVIETLAGVLTVQVHSNGTATVDMGKPDYRSPPHFAAETLTLPHQEVQFHEVSMGNPHAVIFTNDLDSEPVDQLGPIIERQPRFPKRTNVEWVETTGSNSIRVKVWERGAGLTLACGTGACAAAVAAIAAGRVKSPVDVHLPGGKLKISWEPGKSVQMEGPAVEVFRGELSL